MTSTSRALLIFILSFVATSTFATDYFWVGGTGSWADVTHWATASGGLVKHTQPPTANDDVYFDANSFTAPDQTVTLFAEATCRNLNWTGVTNNPTFASFFEDLNVFGSLIIPSTVGRDFTGDIHMLANSGAVDIDLDNLPISEPNHETIFFEGDATWNLQDDMTLNEINISSGTFNTNDFEIVSNNFIISGSNSKVINLGSSDLTAGWWRVQSTTGLTFNAGASNMNVSGIFDGAGLFYHDVVFDGTITLTGNNTFNTIVFSAGATVKLTAGTVQTISDLVSDGTDISPVTVKSTLEGSSATFSKATGSITLSYVRLQDNVASGGAAFTANNSVDLGNVSGWAIPVVEPTMQTSMIMELKALINSVAMNWDPGDGAKRLILAKAGSSVDATPSDDVAYTSGDFGAGSEIGTGNFVVYASNGSSAVIAGLTANTTYYFKIFEFNGAGADVDFLTVSPPALSITTLASDAVIMSNAPVTLCSGTHYSTGGSFYYDNNENFIQTLSPENIGSKLQLTFNDFYLGSITDNLIIYDGPSTSAPVIGSFMGANSPGTVKATNPAGKLTLRFISDNFATSTGWNASISCFILDNEPTLASSTLLGENVSGQSLTLKWTNGNGSRRIVIARAVNVVTATPADGTDYPASANFGTGPQIATDQFVVYNGTGSQVTITGLAFSTQYHFAIYEYNGANTSANYDNTSAIGNLTTSAIQDPPTQNGAIQHVTSLFNSLRLNWRKGNGNGRIIVASTNDFFAPTDGNIYEANTAFGEGAEIGNDAFVVYNGSADSTIEITGLEMNTDYYLSVIEYTGNGSNTNYIDAFYVTQTTTLKMKPTEPASNLVISNVTASTMDLAWQRGNGDYVIVIGRSLAPAELDFRDSTMVYGAWDERFGSGSRLGMETTVLYHGSENTFTVKGLRPLTAYHFAVVEMNAPYVEGNVYNYFLTDDAPAKSGTTTAGKNYYWVKGAGDWSDYANHWAKSSGGSTFHETMPTESDNVFFDGNSFSADSQKVVIDTMVNCLALDWSGIDQNVFFEADPEDNSAYLRVVNVHGSMILSNKLTTGIPRLNFKSQAKNTILSLGEKRSSTYPYNYISFEGRLGSWILSGDLSAQELYLTYGHLNAPESKIEANYVSVNSDMTADLGNSMIRALVWRNFWTDAPAASVTGGYATISNALDLDFANFKTVTCDGSELQLLGGGFLDSLKFVHPGSTLQLEAGETFSINSIEMKDDPLNPALFSYLVSTNAGEAAILHKSTGTLDVNRVRIQDNQATGGASFIATNSIALANVSGWNLTAPKIIAPNFAPWNLKFQNVRSSTMELVFNGGDGVKTLIVAKEGSPVEFGPQDNLEIKASSTFGDGTDLDNENFVVYDSTNDNIFTLDGLKAGTEYHFRIYSFNEWNDSTAFSISYTSSSVFTLEEQDIYLNNVPQQTCNANFYDNGGTGNYVGNSFVQTITPADPQLNLAVQFDEFLLDWFYDSLFVYDGTTTGTAVLGAFTADQKPALPLYATSSSGALTFEFKGKGWSKGVGWKARLFCAGTLASEPGTQSTLSIIAKTDTSLTVNAINGNGTGRLIIARNGAPVDVSVTDAFPYVSNTIFGLGDEIGEGNFIVYSGSAEELTVTGLLPNTTYFFKSFEFNGNNATTNYNINDPGEVADTTHHRKPKLPPALHFVYALKNSARLEIAAGDGSGQLLLVKAGSPITLLPQDGNNYTSVGHNFGFAEGPLLGDSTYVLWRGNAWNLDVEKLNEGTTYHIKAFEYVGEGNRIQYLNTESSEISFTTQLPALQIERIDGNLCSSRNLTTNVNTFDPEGDPTPFNEGNMFTLQLSDASGTFNMPLMLADSIDGASGTFSINSSLPEEVTAGSYQLRIVATDPPVISDTFDLYVPDFPENVTITFEGGLLTSSESEGNQWLLNQLSINGATAQTFELTGSGTYQTSVTSDGCVVMSNEIVITHVEELKADNRINVYPTLVEADLHIETSLSLPLRFEIINMHGQLVKNGALQDQKTTLSLAPLAEGIYLIKFGNGKIMRKIIRD